MTQSTGNAHARWLGGIAAATLAFAGANIALASDSTDAKAEPRETVIVKIVHRDGQGAKGHEIDVIERCGDTKPQVDTSEDVKDDDGKLRRSRIVICNRNGDGDTLSALEKARARLADVTELSDRAKAKALASIDQEIARLKAPSGYSKQ